MCRTGLEEQLDRKVSFFINNCLPSSASFPPSLSFKERGPRGVSSFPSKRLLLNSSIVSQYPKKEFIMIENLKTIADLAGFLSTDAATLTGFVPDRFYHTFYVKKPGSKEKRLIETPTGILRTWLDRIANDLQYLYQQHKTDAAFGFVRCYKTDADKRNISTNAQKHLGKKYLLNIDLDNFFHQVDLPKLHGIFGNYRLFALKPDTEQLLAKLVTCHGRTPMGSPTSPPLSNFATMGLDDDLLKWARQSAFTYTRYVDDLSFSSNMAISQAHFGQINEILQSHRFAADAEKIKWYGKDDEKEITGLLLGEKIRIPEVFFAAFDKDLDKFREIWVMAHQYPDHHVFEWIEKLDQVINGRLAFLSMIYSRNHQVFRDYVKKIKTIKQSHETELSSSWRYAGYEYF